MNVFDFVSQAADPPLIRRLVDGVDDVGVEGLPLLQEAKTGQTTVISLFCCTCSQADLAVALTLKTLSSVSFPSSERMVV